MVFIDKATSAIRLAQWIKWIEEAKSSGLTIHNWCVQNGLSENAFYYWQRKARKKIIRQTVNERSTLLEENSAPDFFEIAIPKPASPVPIREQAGAIPTSSVDTPLFESGITIRHGEFYIGVNQTFSPDTLSKILKVMSNV